MYFVGSYTPISTEYAIISLFFTKLASDNIKVIVVSNHFITLPIRNSIIRHDSCSFSGTVLQFKCTLLIRYLMKVIVLSWINSEFTTTIMSITSCFTRATTRPVLSHSIYTLKTPSSIESIFSSRGLETIAISLSYICHQFWVFRIGALETEPTRFSTQVNLWRQTSSKS